MVSITRLTAFALLASVAGSLAANASEVVINVASKQSSALHQEIVGAARQICAEPDEDGILPDASQQNACVGSAVHQAMAQLQALTIDRSERFADAMTR